jgi:adenylate cyclase class 2
MGQNQQELEVKLYLENLPALKGKLERLGAELTEARLHEVNLRFDLPDGELTRSAQVLRLRQDTAARITYKGPGEMIAGVHARREIEFAVSDFESAQSLLEILGYQVSLMYEKYRTTYTLDGLQITLDEMPYGHFTEIEGSDTSAIHQAAGNLDLSWEARIPESYTSLFDLLKEKLALTFRDLSFANFADLKITAEDLGVIPADQ